MAPQAGLVAGWCPGASGGGGNVDDMVMAMKAGAGMAV